VEEPRGQPPTAPGDQHGFVAWWRNRWRGPVIGAVALLTAVGVAGCGSGNGSSTTTVQHTTPNVVGQRLDLAEGKLRGLGISFKAVGGGGKVLPIAITKRWMVCRTMPSAGTQIQGPVALVVNYVGKC
jgi:hypothetical protein